MDIGIDSSHIIRLGSKSTTRTKPLTLNEQRSARRNMKDLPWNVLNTLEDEATELKDLVETVFQNYQTLTGSNATILSYIQFEDEDFYAAFEVPEEIDGMQIVGRKGQAIKPDYLLDRWLKGEGPGVLASKIPQGSSEIWSMKSQERLEKYKTWLQAILEEHASLLQARATAFNTCQAKIDNIWSTKDRKIINERRIIGCTTTGAAMAAETLREAKPDVVVLEEAGEILESHVLTAMSDTTKQLIMIGDHKQLRPKINNYALTVEKDEGYDLNRSLFERLILAGFPHTTLLKQHRMCPEISTLVRKLTYPDLEDDEKTKNRSPPRGLQDRVIFVQHRHPEASFADIKDSRDEGTKQSKRNQHEADIVLQVIKYLGQQGYGTDRLVILTPYLGQLHLLLDQLSKTNDPVLNDLDSHDLIKAGLLSKAGASQSKRPIKLSTIDNYQGEESDIVIVSLTRSNQAGDIGFMSAPQRVNVMLSRARDILIMIGNMETFTASRKGREAWVPLFEMLKENGHIYDGLPIKCEQHPTKKAMVVTQEDFETNCPDGGCSAPW